MPIAIKLSSGNWRLQVYKKINGKGYRKSITAPTKKEAEHLAELWATEIEEEVKNEKLKAVFDDYIQTCKAQGLSPSTIMEYASRAKTAFPDLLDFHLKAITTNHIQKALNARSETVSAKTLRNDLSFLRAAVASRNHNIKFDRIKIAKRKKRKKLEMKEEWKILIPAKYAEIYGKDEYYLYLLLLIYAGLRPSESHALKWEDVSKAPKAIGNLKTGCINVSKAVVRTVDHRFEEKSPKTESGIRMVTVPWELIQEIVSILPRQADAEQIFHLSPYSMDKRWKRLKAELNLPDEMRRYDLRHYFATSLVISGATEEELQQQMGHSTSSFSHSIYVEIMQDHQTATTARFIEASALALAELTKKGN